MKISYNREFWFLRVDISPKRNPDELQRNLNIIPITIDLI